VGAPFADGPFVSEGEYRELEAIGDALLGALAGGREGVPEGLRRAGWLAVQEIARCERATASGELLHLARKLLHDIRREVEAFARLAERQEEEYGAFEIYAGSRP
jgi:hypothetical protein